MTHVATLETARLRLRELAERDAPFLFELMNDPEYLRHIGDRNVRSVEDARDYICAKIFDSYARHGFGMYLVERKSDASPVGVCGFVRRDVLEHADLGYALLPSCRGRGYALEAAEAMLGYGAAKLGLERVLALTADGNAASIRLLEKLGFRFDRMVRLSDDGDACRLFVR